MYLAILGRQPELSFAELQAVFGAKNVKLHKNLAIISVAEITAAQFSRLGGTVKIAEIISSDWNDVVKCLPSFGKVTIGFSAYGTKLTAKTLGKIGLEIKKARGSVRLLPQDQVELATAAVFHNKLHKGENRFEFIFAQNESRKVLARTVFVQDIDSYSNRDYGRPRRDAQVGMLPPKLAQIMLNLALRETPGRLESKPLKKDASLQVPVVLDPFCGTGVVLQEAALMGYNVYGSDLEPRMIEYTKENLSWLKATRKLKFFDKLELADATDHEWQPVMNFVVSEVYLGKAYFVEPPLDVLKNNVKNCNLLLEKFLSNIAKQLPAKTRLCLGVPVWKVGGRAYRLPVIKELERLGFAPDTPDEKPLIYRRQDQIVGRELLVLTKK